MRPAGSDRDHTAIIHRDLVGSMKTPVTPRRKIEITKIIDELFTYDVRSNTHQSGIGRRELIIFTTDVAHRRCKIEIRHGRCLHLHLDPLQGSFLSIN